MSIGNCFLSYPILNLRHALLWKSRALAHRTIAGVCRQLLNANLIFFLTSTFFPFFWYFWLTIQNTADRQVRNLFCLLAVFISFPLARALLRKSMGSKLPTFFYGSSNQLRALLRV
jgi:hypothetical protein